MEGNIMRNIFLYFRNVMCVGANQIQAITPIDALQVYNLLQQGLLLI